jgi:methionyl-tRNA synthetase
MSKPFYITTPIYYVNDIPHIGHAYTTLAADTLTRWHQLIGDQTYFLTGTDEHGLKIEQAARKSGVSPQEHVDRYSQPFRTLCDTIDARPNDFIRTTEPRHIAFVQEIWERMKDDIYLGEYSGWYSVGDEAFFTEDELVNGKAPSGHDVSWVTEKSYFFRLSNYTDRLLAYFDANPDFIKPENRFNEIKSFVKQGLRDLSISRTTFSWGIPVPQDPKHIIYVWVDALSNYISALGGVDSDKYNQFWPSAIHLIGKDILRFHCVFWPCFLMSAGLPLPKQVFAHGWWTNEGEKMSKTKGNTIDPELVVKAIGPDAFRYFVLREIPFGSDGDFSQSALISRVNHELGNDFGNLFNRTLAMLNKYRDSKIPDISQIDQRFYGDAEKELFQIFGESRSELIESMNDFRFHDALKAIWKLISFGNRYITMKAPWVLAKQNQNEELDVVLYHLCELIRITAVWNLPFLPQKAKLLLDGLGVTQDHLKDFKSTETFGQLPAHTEVIKELVLFPRVEGPLVLSKAQQQNTSNTTEQSSEKGKKMSSSTTVTPEVTAAVSATTATVPTEVNAESQMIDIDHFAKIQLKVAVVLAAEKVEKADKLLKLTLDAGEAQPRTVLSGIAQHYTPESMVGRRVVLLANLKPRKIRGIESHGMLLAGSHENIVKLLDISSDLPAGSTIG